MLPGRSDFVKQFHIAGLLILLFAGCGELEQEKLQNQIAILEMNQKTQQRVIDQQQRVIAQLTEQLEAAGITVAPGAGRETQTSERINENNLSAIQQDRLEKLAGSWQITDGKKIDLKVQLNMTDDLFLRLSPEASIFSGKYRWHELKRRLILVAENPGYPDLVWEQLSANHFMLIGGGDLNTEMKRLPP